MRIFVLENDAMMMDRTFGPQPILIGSSGDCTVVLPDAQVAARHLRLVPNGAGDWSLQLVDTRTPVKLNGTAISEGQRIKDRDEIAVGRYVLKVYLSMEGASGTLRAARRDDGLPAGAILVSHAGTASIPISKLSEAAQLAMELSGLATVELVMERALPATLAAFHASAGTICARVRTAAGLEVVRSVDARGRPTDPQPNVAKMHERCQRTQYRVCVPDAETLGVSSLMAVPILGAKGAVIGMLYVESQASDVRYDGTALDGLTAWAAAIAGPLERAIHGVVVARQEMADRELTTARAVQDALTVRGMPHWPDLQVAALRRPGAARVRDVYDLLRLANRTVALVVARIDAPPTMLARLMSEVRAAFRVSSLHADAPHVLARAINWLVHEGAVAWTVELATAWIMPASGVVKYCVAGSENWLGKIADGDWHRFDAVEMPAIGKSRGFAYTSSTESLAPGEPLVMMTDGFETLTSASGERFGRRGVVECLRDTAGMAINTQLADVARELDEFVVGGAAPDDATIVVAARP
ncbi:MAG: SpoIIE family protein phosphatase [Phycisphaerae bacterium]